ncbi:MAG TPA: YbdK family carboxylate-amine ligase [Solirubrobacteraceae bacterium]|nr:YbdK family carboxylate-amine ligase [Solirubrobacteraceae bacterium]
MTEPTTPTAAELRAAFDAPEPLTLGLEEELMLLHPGTLDLLPRAREVIDAARDDRFKLELPAAQLELSLPPERSVPAAIAALGAARRDLAAAAEPVGRLATAGVHPFAAVLGELNVGERYDLTHDEYGDIARSQLVCALQVHVAVGGAEPTLAVYNGLRPWLPLLAALAANAPFHGGRDTGMASVRPKIGEQLPRQGIPPAIGSWEALADALRWGAASGAVPEPRRWWWELRPHPSYGTLEVRVPDAQATVEDAAAVAAVVHALVAWLRDRAEAGEPVATADTWRLEENRWRAARWGMDAELAHLGTGAATPARECLAQLVEDLVPYAERLGCAAELRDATRLAGANGAVRQRAVAADGDLRAVAAWLADAYVPSADYALSGAGREESR